MSKKNPRQRRKLTLNIKHFWAPATLPSKCLLLSRQRVEYYNNNGRTHQKWAASRRRSAVEPRSFGIGVESSRELHSPEPCRTASAWKQTKHGGMRTKTSKSENSSANGPSDSNRWRSGVRSAGIPSNRFCLDYCLSISISV